MKNVFTFSIFMLLSCFNAQSQWAQNPTVNNQISTTYSSFVPKIISDSQNGYIVIWITPESTIRAQRVSSTGYNLWGDGVVLTTSSESNDFPSVEAVGDGSGGAVVSWVDNRNPNTNSQIYTQRVSGDGVVLWGENGIVLTPDIWINHSVQSLVGDGNGGAIVAWQDGTYLSGVEIIYAQHISANGALMWEPAGRVISNTPGYGYFGGIISDGLGGTILVWTAGYFSTFKIYGQRLNPDGNNLWDNNGRALVNVAGDTGIAGIVSDHNHGAIVSWVDYTNDSDYNLYAQKISSAGTLDWLLPSVAVCNIIGNLSSVRMQSDPDGNCYFAWADMRNGSNSSEVYTQKITPSGDHAWALNGVASGVGTEQNNPDLVLTDGGIIATWNNGHDPYIDVYAQKFDTDGNRIWNNSGAIVSNAPNDQFGNSAVSDGTGGAVVVWEDKRNVFSQIYGQRICQGGNLNSCTLNTPEFASVGDWLTLSPNPASKLFSITSSYPIENISITNVLGETQNYKVNTTDTMIDISSFNSGVYFITVNSANATITKKLVVK